MACRNNQRLMLAAFHMYAEENNSYFPGNESDQLASNWITYMEVSEPRPMTNALHPTNFPLAPYVPATLNILKCPGDVSSARTGRREVPRIRSISMNHAIGTRPSSGPQKAPVNGIWLTGDATHTANSRFFCYAKISDLVDPAPSRLWVFIEEHPDSINDGAFGNVGPIPASQYRMIDFPAAWHNGASILGFADSHVEERKWVDPRTVVPSPFSPYISYHPNNSDITWLANRTTAAVPR